MSGDQRSFRQVWRNVWRGDRSVATRLALLARNSARRVTRRDTCCGHPGEPGC